MEENVNVLEENTTSQDAETNQEESNVNGTETATQDGTETGDTSAQSGEDGGTAGEQSEEAPYLEIKFNHEKKGLSKDEATIWAQKGMHYESSYKALERVAALKGVSVNEFLKNVETAEDEAYRQSVIEKYGNDEDIISDMMAIYESRKQKKIDDAAENKRKEVEEREQSTNERIASEFSSMKKDFPELTEYSKLPEAVKKAASEGMNLSHAYLLYMHQENQKAKTAQEQAAAAEKQSAGALGESQADTQTDAEKRFLNSLWN